MGWLTPLYGKTIALDTAPLIYFIEEHSVFYPRVEQFFLAMRRGDFEVVTSVLTLTEALVHPIRHNKPKLAETYRDILLHTNHLKTIPPMTTLPKRPLGFVLSTTSAPPMPSRWRQPLSWKPIFS